jgi:AraC-like DNA-binding protein
MQLDREVIMREGSFIFFKPGEKQIHTQRDHEVSEFYYIHFNAPEDFDLFGFESSVVYSVDPSIKINELFEEIIEELQNKKPIYEKICAAKFFNILALLERRYTKENTPLVRYVDKISSVMQVMNREYEKNYSLGDYARMCCMSKYHFLRIFKQITGYTPIEYRNNIRIEHAKEMLADADDLISEIGRSVGYESSVYFCDAFKAKFGMSPSEYRKTCR